MCLPVHFSSACGEQLNRCLKLSSKMRTQELFPQSFSSFTWRTATHTDCDILKCSLLRYTHLLNTDWKGSRDKAGQRRNNESENVLVNCHDHYCETSRASVQRAMKPLQNKHTEISGLRVLHQKQNQTGCKHETKSP